MWLRINFYISCSWKCEQREFQVCDLVSKNSLESVKYKKADFLQLRIMVFHGKSLSGEGKNSPNS